MLQKIRNIIEESRLNQDARGASSVEYLIVVGLIAFVVFASYQTFGNNVKTKVDAAATTVNGMQIGTGTP
ncbi:MAG: Flp family type IVb pilin [Myxococcota bacterium]